MNKRRFEGVTFTSRYDSTHPWTEEENVNPYISMEDFETDIKRQRFPSEIVIPLQNIRVTFDYPFAHPTVFLIQADNPRGFTRAHLARRIGQIYHQLYEEEENAVGNPGHIPGMLNRKTSYGPHGISMHDLSDLVLHEVVHQGGNQFFLGIDS